MKPDELNLLDYLIPRYIEDWHEDHGNCLWWSFPIDEAPYVGTPLDVDFPSYKEHFTKMMIPFSPFQLWKATGELSFDMRGMTKEEVERYEKSIMKLFKPTGRNRFEDSE